MSIKPNDPLLASARVVILIAQGLMVLSAAALTVALVTIPFLRESITAEISAELADPDFVFPLFRVLALMALALAIVVPTFFFLRHMRRIVDTVGEGDPFVPLNAQRLTAMAWLMLLIQVLTIPLALMAMQVMHSFSEANGTMDADIDLSGIVLVLVLFILARVFRHGAAMREDLEGTV